MEIIVLEKIEKFIKSLDNKTMSRCHALLNLLKDHGHKLRMPHSKMILNNIFELRVISILNIRLIYTFRDNMIMIFYAFEKKTQKIQVKELSKILELYKDL